MELDAGDDQRLRSIDSLEEHQGITSLDQQTNEFSTIYPSGLDVEADASDPASTAAHDSSDTSPTATPQDVDRDGETQSNHNNVPADSSHAENEAAKEGSGDEHANDNPGNADQNCGSRLLGLSNEVLTSIILNLDPPTVVCFWTYLQTSLQCHFNGL
jgi:hypothetical protein